MYIMELYGEINSQTKQMIYTLVRKVYQKAELNLSFDTIQKISFEQSWSGQ